MTSKATPISYDLLRLARTVRGQREHLHLLLNAGIRDEADLHIQLAGTLRTMLCEKEQSDRCSTLLVLARELGVELTAYGPLHPNHMKQPPPDILWLPSVVSAIPMTTMLGPAYKLTASEWLEAPIGVHSPAASAVSGVEPPAEWYTPVNLIKLTSNKDGGSHYQPKPDPKLEAIKNSMQIEGTFSVEGPQGTLLTLGANDGVMVRSPIIQIAQWAVHQADKVLVVASKIASTPAA